MVKTVLDILRQLISRTTTSSHTASRMLPYVVQHPVVALLSLVSKFSLHPVAFEALTFW